MKKTLIKRSETPFQTTNFLMKEANPTYISKRFNLLLDAIKEITKNNNSTLYFSENTIQNNINYREIIHKDTKEERSIIMGKELFSETAEEFRLILEKKDKNSALIYDKKNEVIYKMNNSYDNDSSAFTEGDLNLKISVNAQDSIEIVSKVQNQKHNIYKTFIVQCEYDSVIQKKSNYVFESDKSSIVQSINTSISNGQRLFLITLSGCQFDEIILSDSGNVDIKIKRSAFSLINKNNNKVKNKMIKELYENNDNFQVEKFDLLEQELKTAHEIELLTTDKSKQKIVPLKEIIETCRKKIELNKEMFYDLSGETEILLSKIKSSFIKKQTTSDFYSKDKTFSFQEIEIVENDYNYKEINAKNLKSLWNALLNDLSVEPKTISKLKNKI